MLVVLSSTLVAMDQSPLSLGYKLIQAAQNGTQEEVEELLLKGVSPLVRPSTIAFRHEIPLMVALNHKNEAAWKVLMSYRFEEQAKVRGLNGYTLMHYTAGNHCMEVFKELKKLGMDVNDCDNAARITPLISAIEGKTTDEKKLEMIEALLGAGANPTMEAGEGNAIIVASRQPFPIKKKLLKLLQKRRD